MADSMQRFVVTYSTSLGMHTGHFQFLDVLDNVIIPRDYPEVSSRVADKTSLGSLQFSELLAKLDVHPLQGWTVEPDKEMVLLFQCM